MYKQLTIKQFNEELSSSLSTPGGGGVASVISSFGVCLASMVTNLTIGKKTYLMYEQDHKKILKLAKDYNNKFLELVDLDAINFKPLLQAYKIKAETKEEKELKELKIQECLILASKAPIEILKLSIKSVELFDELLEKGSKMMLSDVGVGILALEAGIKSAYINVMINLNSIKNESYKKEVLDEILNQSKKALIQTKRIYQKTLEILDFEEI